MWRMLGGLVLGFIFICFYFITWIYDFFTVPSRQYYHHPSKEEKEPVKTRIKCADDEHTLEEVTHRILAGVKTPTDGVAGVVGNCVRLECTKCIHVERFEPMTDKQNVRELNLDPAEYDIFASPGRVLILQDDDDIIIAEEEEAVNEPV